MAITRARLGMVHYPWASTYCVRSSSSRHWREKPNLPTQDNTVRHAQVTPVVFVCVSAHAEVEVQQTLQNLTMIVEERDLSESDNRRRVQPCSPSDLD